MQRLIKIVGYAWNSARFPLALTWCARLSSPYR